MSQFVTHYLGKTGAITLEGNHGRQIVVYSPSEYASQYYPKIGGRTKQDTLNSTEDGARARNVEKLNEIYLPGGHRNEVHTVLTGVARGLAMGVRMNETFYQFAVGIGSHKQYNKRNNKSVHGFSKTIVLPCKYTLFLMYIYNMV